MCSYCDIASKLGLLEPEYELQWRLATLQEGPGRVVADAHSPRALAADSPARSPLAAAGYGSLSTRAGAHGAAAPLADVALPLSAAPSTAMVPVTAGSPYAGSELRKPLNSPSSEDDSVIPGRDEDSEDELSVAASGTMEAVVPAPPASVPAHIVFAAPVPSQPSEAVDDRIAQFQQMLSKEWFTNLGLGEPPYTTVTPTGRACHDFLWFTPVRAYPSPPPSHTRTHTHARTHTHSHS